MLELPAPTIGSQLRFFVLKLENSLVDGFPSGKIPPQPLELPQPHEDGEFHEDWMDLNHQVGGQSYFDSNIVHKCRMDIL